MAVRTTLGAAFSGSGPTYAGNVEGHIDLFWNASTLRITGVAGTANDPTGVVDPVLDVGLVAGMSFYFDPISDNTSTMTLKIGSESAVAITTADGAALIAGAILIGTVYLLHFDGTKMRIMSTAGIDETGAVLVIDTFTGSGTLTKPTQFPDDGLVVIESWGGGGGGATDSTNGGGGGGGGYCSRHYSGSDLGVTETVTIGAGGAIEVDGGDTTVGTLCTGLGGDFGVQFVGGAGGKSGAGGSTASSDHFNGGKGGSTGQDGAAQLFGGGGGGADGNVGGASIFGGDGGADTVGGSIPAGGGGSQAAGARGEVRVRWIG